MLEHKFKLHLNMNGILFFAIDVELYVHSLLFRKNTPAIQVPFYIESDMYFCYARVIKLTSKASCSSAYIVGQKKTTTNMTLTDDDK